MRISGNELGLNKLGIVDLVNVHRNLSVESMVDDIVNNNEGVIGLRGAAMVDTGIYTGRSLLGFQENRPFEPLPQYISFRLLEGLQSVLEIVPFLYK